MSPARFSVDQPILVNLGALIVVIAGAVVVAGMPREAYPTVSIGWARVTTVLPGASPEDVERLVTVPIEDAIAELDGVARVVSYSREGVSAVGVELEADVDDPSARIAAIAGDLPARVSLPAEADPPVVTEERVRRPALTVAVRGDVAPAVLQSAARLLEGRLARVPGVDGVDAIGLATRELRVDVHPDRLRAAGVGLGAVVDTVRARGATLSAGRVDDGVHQRVVRADIAPASATALRDAVLRPDPGGASVRVGDVAAVRDTYAEGAVVARVDAAPAVVFEVFPRASVDTSDVVGRVRGALASAREAMPAGTEVLAFDDASREIDRVSRVLYRNASLGLVLVFITLALFLRAGTAFVAAVGLPVALAGGVLAMEAMGIGLNVLSLGALILCLGLVVDDAIVVAENVQRHLEMGKPARTAAIDGTQEVLGPVVSATATTCAAFLPLLVMPGVLGEFFAIVPKVVVVVLGASLVEALLVLPSHVAELGSGRAESGPRARLAPVRGRFMAHYEGVLRAALARPVVTLGAAYGVFAAFAAWTALTKDVVLLADTDLDAFEIRLEMPVDRSVDTTGVLLREVEDRLQGIRTDDVDAVWTTRGRSRDGLRVVEEDHVGLATVVLRPSDARSGPDAGRALLARAAGAFGDLAEPTELQVVERAVGPPVGAPVEVRLAGDDPERLSAIARQVEAELRALPGVVAVESTEAGRRRELRVDVDEGRAAPHGLTAADVGGWVRAAFSAAPVATTFMGNERVELVVALDAEVHDAGDLAGLVLRSGPAADVTVGDVATVTEVLRPTHIRRNDRRRGVRVSGWLDGKTSPQAAARALRDRIAPLSAASPDVSITLAGEARETSTSLRSLGWAFGLAVLAIYAILATQFRSLLDPIVVVAAIPLSSIGVALGFLATGASIGLIALVGAVGLAGIVVNDALVLVDFMRRARAAGDDLEAAIVAACRTRVRPVLATSATTIVGILPLALAGSAAPLLSPMAIALAAGLAAATVLTLVVVPAAYLLTARLGARAGATWRRARGLDD